jgi:hypothetical protein
VALAHPGAHPERHSRIGPGLGATQHHATRGIQRRPSPLAAGIGTLDFVQLEGWNSIPGGYAADFDLRDAPWWLRLLFGTPFIDRFAYPAVVRRGYGWLSPHPGLSADQLGNVPAGWRIRPGDYEAPGSTGQLA